MGIRSNHGGSFDEERRQIMPSYKGLVAQIEGLNEELSRWHNLYAALREQLEIVDREIMARHKTKWRLERELIPVTPCKPCGEPRAVTRKPKKDPLEFDVKNLTLAELQVVLMELKRQRAEEEEE
jgi:hypothetical protein